MTTKIAPQKLFNMAVLDLLSEATVKTIELQEKNKKLKEKNKKLKEYILAVDSCILFAPRGQVRQRYEELDKSWFNEEEEEDSD